MLFSFIHSCIVAVTVNALTEVDFVQKRVLLMTVLVRANIAEMICTDQWRHATIHGPHQFLSLGPPLAFSVFVRGPYRWGPPSIDAATTRVVVSVSRQSRDVFFKRLGLVSVSAKCGKVSISVSSRTESQTSQSRLGLGPQRLVYKLTFKQIFQFLSFSYKTNMSDICFSYIALSFTCFCFVKSST